MSKRSQDDLLSDIIEASTRTLMYTKELNFEEFRKDIKTQDAVIRNLEIVGEAVKNVSTEFKDSLPEIPWKSISGMRDKLIHDYFGINIDIVWGVIEKDIPDLIRNIKSMDAEFEGDEG